MGVKDRTVVRGHSPIELEKFNGLWQRGDSDNTPIDHFQDCNNIRFVGQSSFGSRYGIGISQNVSVPLSDVRRIYNFPQPTGNTLIILSVDDSGNGNIYHFVNSTTIYGPVLTIAGMTDFAFVPYDGRAYISPFTSYTSGDLFQELGMQSQFLYVYKGDGTNARKAAGAAPSGGNLTAANGAAGNTDAGFHLFAAIYEFDTGYLSPPGYIVGFTTCANFSVSFGRIPTGGATVTKVHLVATKAITSYNGNTTGYTFYDIPGAIVTNGTNSLNNISFFDADLLQDESHLLNNFSQIPAGSVLGLYHNRLCVAATYTDISVIYLSSPGEPEAIDQVNGLIIVPLDGNPITNLQEMMDVLYVMKRARTVAYSDNQGEPATWILSPVDNSLGTCVHGIATVLDSGGTTVTYLIVCTYLGVMVFNGTYIVPELSWKIQFYWSSLNQTNFRFIQIINALIQKELYIVTPDRKLLVGNYNNGMDSKNIRWTPLQFQPGFSSIAIWDISTIIIGSNEGL